MASGVGLVRARVGMKTAAGKKMPTASSLGRRRVGPWRHGAEVDEEHPGGEQGGEKGVEMKRAGIDAVEESGEGDGGQDEDVTKVAR